MENKKIIQNQFDVKCHPEQSKGSYNDKEFFANAQNDSKIAVLLVNFGGPTGLHNVKPFLYNLFSDPTVLNFPFVSPNSQLAARSSQLFSLYRKPLAWLISNMRDMTSREMYKKIGSITPLIPITYLVAEKLQNLFNKNTMPINVFVGFRYCKPFIEDVLSDIVAQGYEQLIILPLYPQYSYATTGSAQLVVNKWLKKTYTTRHCEEAPRADEAISKRYEIASPSARNDNKKLTIYTIKEWYKDEDYIESFVSLIRSSLKNLDLRSTEIIFSAHSIPVFNIKNGDPYENQIKETANLIIQKLGWKKKWHIAYQSKLGPIKWLEPGTDKVIEEIARKNKNINIIVVPISFVCEHVETIYEIGKLYKDIANKHGIKRFVRLPALNTDKYLIQALYNQIVGCLESNQINVKELLFAK